jgi:hypothetical protein
LGIPKRPERSQKKGYNKAWNEFGRIAVVVILLAGIV